MKTNYRIVDDGSCIRIFLGKKVVAIVEDFYYYGHVHAAFRQLLEQNADLIEDLKIYNDRL